MSTDATPIIASLLSEFIGKVQVVEELVQDLDRLANEHRGEQRAEHQRILDAQGKLEASLTAIIIDLTKITTLADVQSEAQKESRDIRRQLLAPILDKWPYAVAAGLASVSTWLATSLAG